MLAIFNGEYSIGPGDLCGPFVSKPLLFFGTEYYDAVFTFDVSMLSWVMYDPGPVPSRK